VGWIGSIYNSTNNENGKNLKRKKMFGEAHAGKLILGHLPGDVSHEI
jgi:hypothetical protein